MNDKSTAKLREALQGDLTDYQGIPFWSWNNALDEEKLVKQIEEMAFQNCDSLQSVSFENDSQLESLGDYTFSFYISQLFY